jgi:hypothetical protein
MKCFKVAGAVFFGLVLALSASAFEVKFKPGMVLKGQLGTITVYKPGSFFIEARGAYVIRFDDGDDCHINLLTLHASGPGCAHVSIKKQD